MYMSPELLVWTEAEGLKFGRMETFFATRNRGHSLLLLVWSSKLFSIPDPAYNTVNVLEGGVFFNLIAKERTKSVDGTLQPEDIFDKPVN